MGTFAELIEALSTKDSELAQQLQAAYNKDVAAVTESEGLVSRQKYDEDTQALSAQVETLTTERDTALAARDTAETAKRVAQAHNAQLVKSLPGNDQGSDGDGGTGDNDSGVNPDITIEDLLK